MSDSPWVKDVTEENFEQDVLVASETRPVVIDFWAEYCAPCRKLGPLLERLVHERGGRCALVKVNTVENPGLARYFGISGIPAIRVIAGRQLVNEFEGLLPEPEIQRFLDMFAPMDVPPPAGGPASDEAPPDDAERERRLRARVGQDGDQTRARVSLGELLFEQGKLEEIPAILEPAGADDGADRLLARMWLRAAATSPAGAGPAEGLLAEGLRLADEGKYEAALPAMLAAGEKDFKLAGTKVREAMVKVFYCLGSGHPLANEYRGKLSGLLY